MNSNPTAAESNDNIRTSTIAKICNWLRWPLMLL